MRLLFTILLLTLQTGFADLSANPSTANNRNHNDGITPARNVLQRLIGNKVNNIDLQIIPSNNGFDTFEIQAKDGQLSISGSSTTAICYGFNKYLQEACNSMITWSGKNLNIPATWPDYEIKQVTSPYHYRYFLNVVTFGYTTPYWDWTRWEKELDWMALHGVNMPLATVASEVIAERVWLKMGLTKDEIRAFFTAPAHLPWHRMGNLNKWDGPLTDAWQENQLKLQHQIIDRMRELGQEPIAPAFAGFVPEAFMEKHPELKVKRLKWGGFPEEYNAFVLPPDSPFFEKIGKLFIEEWEKEFGKNTYYLSDSFNEMEVPAPKNDNEAKYKLLADYGESIYKSIIAGNPDAIWVTQGWTFGYQHKFWDRDCLQALLSKVPDDKMVIVDLANDYPKWVWHTDQVWKNQDGFYGKKWIFSYVPNFGGKNPLTGDLSLYASYSAEALRSPYRKNLIGFGSAPEGIENNEVIYELLADMGWQEQEMDMSRWIARYCKARYGAYPKPMAEAWEGLQQSVYSSLYSYPRFTWQTVVPDQRRKNRIDTSPAFFKAVESFLECSDELKQSELYRNDAVELSAFYLCAKADEYYKAALKNDSIGQKEARKKDLKQTIKLLLLADRLLESHPSYRLQTWVDYAHHQATTPEEYAHYESNAKRLITTWGGFQSDYAGRVWSGLIRDYYVPRIIMHLSDKKIDISVWEENWIRKPWRSKMRPYSDPVNTAKRLVFETKNKSL
ncbi:MAG: alpha-N-acetylglucosaminidase TIM-barrel domain-containing protein [Bacteroidales bacterium]|nr:alpha-N-acetylglucosaminidase TIM-barrel domain-containing protein [Bacteroidales bacterium]